VEAVCSFEILITIFETSRHQNAKDHNVNISLRFSVPSFHLLLSHPNDCFLRSFLPKTMLSFLCVPSELHAYPSYPPTFHSPNTVTCDLCKSTKIPLCNTNHLTSFFDWFIHFPQNVAICVFSSFKRPGLT
jgi:hypothetical protein